MLDWLATDFYFFNYQKVNPKVHAHVKFSFKDSQIDETHLCFLVPPGLYETEIGTITSFFEGP